MKADLHMHSTASDGEYAPRALMERAAGAGLDVVALTDHDSVAGVREAEAAARALGIALIPGVELSCGAEKEIHVLGYGLDIGNEALLAFCRERYAEREARARRMVAQLAENGMTISLERVRELARGVIARPHVARALVEAGYANGIQDAFERYLLPGRCGYAPKRDVKVAEAAALIREAGGVAVLAHPMKLACGDALLHALIAEWAGQGIEGVEAYHPSAQNHDAASLAKLARGLDLLVTGGSDFHGEHVREDRRLGCEAGRWETMEGDVRALLARLGAPDEEQRCRH